MLSKPASNVKRHCGHRIDPPPLDKIGICCKLEDTKPGVHEALTNPQGCSNHDNESLACIHLVVCCRCQFSRSLTFRFSLLSTVRASTPQAHDAIGTIGLVAPNIRSDGDMASSASLGKLNLGNDVRIAHYGTALVTDYTTIFLADISRLTLRIRAAFGPCFPGLILQPAGTWCWPRLRVLQAIQSLSFCPRRLRSTIWCS